MNTEQRLKKLEEQVALSSVASFNHGHASVEDLQALNKRLQAIEANDVNPKLVALRNSIKDDLTKQLFASQKQLASHILDIILQENKDGTKQMRQELEVTASAAARSAEIAQQYAATELTAALELLRSKSYQFAHGE